MANDYNNRQGQGQGQTAADKASEFARSAVQQAEEKGKNIAGDAQKMLKQGQEQAGKVMESLDKQVRDNPWPIIAGVAIGAFLLGSLMSKSSK
jgi:ElaB/YqjD/DUF883 family membrane-anchored ribosome-binding protein